MYVHTYWLDMHANYCVCMYIVYVLQRLSDKIASKLESDDFYCKEAQVFYLKMKGDYYRYLTQNVEGVTREGNMHTYIRNSIYYELFFTSNHA